MSFHSFRSWKADELFSDESANPWVTTDVNFNKSDLEKRNGPREIFQGPRSPLYRDD